MVSVPRRPVLRGEVEVDGWCVFEDAVGPFDHQRDAVGVPVQLQALAVYVAVVEPAEFDEVFGFVGAVVFAVFDVVDVGPA